MNSRIRKKLIQVARGRANLMSFQNLVYEAELGLNLDNSFEKSQLNEVICEISEEEHAAGRPLLSSLIPVKGQKNQGDAFFRLCERLGYGDWKDLKKDPQFIEEQREACRSFWQDSKNFTSYL
ncbi:hypothetical protein [Pontibacter sp. SGAir0037]|uniref:hypothetical protein n=1 Tax=Pontibacter sp. SGAir0037 TaxID=2571030 RepID=UPI001F1016F8|nr:hypothetical protein [Pontibacter sp. SGAir0037]